MKKSKFYLISALLFAIMMLYFYSSLKNSSFQADSISILEEIIIFVILFCTYKKITYFKINWLYLSMACFSCLISDSIWIYYTYVLSLNPVYSNLLLYLYLIPNICILISVFLYFINQKNRWNSVQLFLDVVTILSIIAYIAWNLFFHKHMNFPKGISQAAVVNIIYNVTDFLALAMIIVVLLSSGKSRKSQTFKILSLGVIVFTLGDLIYAYQSLNNLYSSNNISDFTYIFSLTLFSIAALYELYKPTIVRKERINCDIHENIKNGKISIILLIVPLLLFVFNLINVKNAIFLIVIIILNHVLSIH